MIKAIGWIIKTGLFAIVVLILGNTLHWGGKTVSDQMKTQISHAQRSDVADSLKRWTRDVTEDAQKGWEKKSLNSSANSTAAKGKTPRSPESHSDEKRRERLAGADAEKIPSSERQKLRALIQELNTSTSADSTN